MQDCLYAAVIHMRVAARQSAAHPCYTRLVQHTSGNRLAAHIAEPAQTRVVQLPNWRQLKQETHSTQGLSTGGCTPNLQHWLT